MKPNGSRHDPENEMLEELEDIEVEHFDPVWTVGGTRAYREGLSIFGARLLFVGFTAAFIDFARSMSDRESGRVKLPEVYDPKSVARYFAIRTDKVYSRALRWGGEATGLALLKLRHQVDARLNAGAGAEVRAKLEASQRDEEARAIRRSVERMGPAFMKFAQAISMRPDLIGAERAKQLQSLTDTLVAPFPSFEAFSLLRKELRAAPADVFDTLSMKPFAGASLGMVYRGTIDGKDVAVKIQRPGAAELVALDFHLLRTFVGWTQWLLRYQGQLRGFVDEYAAEVFEELDYNKEAENMKKFRRMYSKQPGIYVPKAYPRYTSRKVLVAEYIDGTRILDPECEVARADVGLVKTGIEFALKQLLDKGFLHADMHNGNMLVTKSGELAYIDFGMVVNIPERARQSMVLALFYLIHGEYSLLAESFVDLALMEPDDLDAKLPDISAALEKLFSGMNTGAQADPECDPDSPVVCRFTMIGVAEKLVQLGAQFPVAYDSYFINSVRCIAMLEGLALRAEPNFQVLNVVYPVIMQKIFAGPARSEYREALDRVLLAPSGEYQWSKLDGMLQEVALAESESAMMTSEPAERIRRSKRDITAEKPLDNLILSHKGGFLRRQLANEWVMPRDSGSAGRSLSKQVFWRAGVLGKTKAIGTITRVMMMRVFLLFTAFFAHAYRIVLRKPQPSLPEDKASSSPPLIA